MLTEHELVAQAKAGDVAAFESLVSLYEGKLYSLAMSMLQQSEDAEDVVQNTFLKVMDSLPKLREDTAFGPWIRQIAGNFALQTLRRRRTRPTVSLDGMAGATGSDELARPEFIAEWRNNPAELAQRREVRGLLAQALAALPENYRVVFVMRDVNELSVRETAKALKLSEANVKVRLLRARLALREQLTRALGDETRRAEAPANHDHENDPELARLAKRYAAAGHEVQQ